MIADALVLFGITGDLATKSLLPALYRLAKRGDWGWPVIGVTRGGWDAQRLREHVYKCVAVDQGADQIDSDVFATFVDLFRVAAVDYDDPATFTAIADQARDCRLLALYLAIPPSQYVSVAASLAAVRLNESSRLIVEKPFGRDLASARALQAGLTEYFSAEQLRHVDHFLGNDAVLNVHTLRRANPTLEAALRREHVRSVQITMAEDFGITGRGSFYDATGALRDVVENHLFQLLAYFLMDPVRVGGDVAAARTAALRSVRAVRPEDYVRGQFDGYLDVEGVRPDSSTETYAAIRLAVDSERWAGVPFAIRAGKLLPTRAIEVAVGQRRHPDQGTDGAARSGDDVIRFLISPRPGIAFDLLTGKPGAPATTAPVTAAAAFPDLGGTDIDAYENVLADCISGDPERFVDMPSIEQSWRIIADIVDAPGRPLPYEPHTWGPPEADRLVDGGRWIPPSPRG
jgi:glucose-6-phosphate 1-dehydrogenase